MTSPKGSEQETLSTDQVPPVEVHVLQKLEMFAVARFSNGKVGSNGCANRAMYLEE
jgi:hypothetical protein